MFRGRYNYSRFFLGSLVSATPLRSWAIRTAVYNKSDITKSFLLDKTCVKTGAFESILSTCRHGKSSIMC